MSATYQERVAAATAAQGGKELSRTQLIELQSPESQATIDSMEGISDKQLKVDQKYYDDMESRRIKDEKSERAKKEYNTYNPLDNRKKTREVVKNPERQLTKEQTEDFREVRATARLCARATSAPAPPAASTADRRWTDCSLSRRPS
jgi:hypothetical protein